MDPDIVAAMDDDFNFDDPDNELEDDFIAFANGVPSDGETEYVLKACFIRPNFIDFRISLIAKMKKVPTLTAKKKKTKRTMYCATCEATPGNFLPTMTITNRALRNIP